jgi:3D (Asp-Asp-Asp) domain-containing protein
VTIHGSGVYVTNLTGLVLNGGSTLTLVAENSSTQFVINDTGAFSLTGGSHIVAQGYGPNEEYKVLYNVLGSGQAVQLNRGTKNGAPNTTVDGIMLAPNRDINLTPGAVNPEIIGGGSQITITSGGEVEHVG